MISDSSSDESPRNNYFYIMGKVGNDGCYQWMVYVISISLWICYGVFNNSVSLLYLDVQFDCSAFSIP